MMLNSTDSFNDITLNTTDSFNDSATSYTTYVVHHLSNISQIINATISILTIVLNWTIANTLHFHRSKFSDDLWYQLITLTYSDGITGVLQSSLVLFKIDWINTSTSACGIILLTFHTGQLAAVINLFLLSLKRICLLKSSSRVWTRRFRLSVSTSLGVTSWVLSSVFIYPAANWLSEEPTIDGCVSWALFGPLETYYSITLYHTCLISCFVVIYNILYIRMMCILLHRHSEVAPEQTSPDEIVSQHHFGEEGPSASAQRKAFRHLRVVIVTHNLTMLPYIVISMLLITGTFVYDHNWPVFDIHLLTLNSFFGACSNVLFVKELRKIIVHKFHIYTT